MKGSFKSVDQEFPVSPEERENRDIEDYSRCCQLHPANPSHSSRGTRMPRVSEESGTGNDHNRGLALLVSNSQEAAECKGGVQIPTYEV